MKSLFRKVSIAIAISALALILLGAFLRWIGARINSSASIPLGLYWKIDAPIEKGAYVMFCPPQVSIFDDARRRGYIGAGFCPGGYGYVMKKVLAATGDLVTVAGDGVRVNGKLLPLSIPLHADGNGRLLPRFQADSYVLSEYQLLLMSDINPKSFDARYFGPVQRMQVREVIKPVLVWDGSGNMPMHPHP
ncbi:MAG: conjugative transfer signal peptidase TraF [Pseudomonadota bacterium]